jgi:hypothetical protein
MVELRNDPAPDRLAGTFACRTPEATTRAADRGSMDSLTMAEKLRLETLLHARDEPTPACRWTSSDR